MVRSAGFPGRRGWNTVLLYFHLKASDEVVKMHGFFAVKVEAGDGMQNGGNILILGNRCTCADSVYHVPGPSRLIEVLLYLLCCN